VNELQAELERQKNLASQSEHSSSNTQQQLEGKSPVTAFTSTCSSLLQTVLFIDLRCVCNVQLDWQPLAPNVIASARICSCVKTPLKTKIGVGDILITTLYQYILTTKRVLTSGWFMLYVHHSELRSLRDAVDMKDLEYGLLLKNKETTGQYCRYLALC